MKRIIIVLCLLISFIDLKASPQLPDFFIVGQDTVPIFYLPLHSLDSITLKSFFDNLQSDTMQFGISFNLWRGYQAYWQLLDEKLYLVGLKDYSNSEFILRKTFPNYYENGKVLAYWFNSYLSIGKSKLLKWDGIFSRTYFKEEIFQFIEGNLTDHKIVDNYIDLPNGISRLDTKKVTNRIFKKIKKLNWKKLSETGCDDEYLVTINENGKISKIEFTPIFDTEKENTEYAEEYKMCTETLLKQLETMQFDIITWNGQPYSEKIRIELFYDKRLENWTE